MLTKKKILNQHNKFTLVNIILNAIRYDIIIA